VRYIPGAVVKHEGGGGIGQPYLRSMMMVNRVRHYRVHHSTVATCAFYFAVLLSEGIRAAAGNVAAKAAVTALVRPSARPVELHASEHLIPG
jgi:hypothetical protein